MSRPVVPSAPVGALAPKRALPIPGVQTPGGQIVRRGEVERTDAIGMCKLLTDTMRLIHECSHAKCSFQQLHTTGYQLVTHQQGALLFSKVDEEVTERVRLQNAVVRAAKDSAFLSVLAEQWKRHLVTTDRCGQMLMFFNKNYCLVEGHPTTRALSMRVFGEELLKDSANADRFRAQILDIVWRERNGELTPHRTLLRELADMMIEVDHRGLFEALIEGPYLAASREFYRAEAARLISSASTPQFVTAFLTRYEEERDRVHRLLEEATLAKISAVLREEFLDPHKQRLLARSGSGCTEMLSHWREAELRDLYAAFHFAHDVPMLVEHVRGFLLHEGDLIVLDQAICQQPTHFVEKLIGLRQRMDALVREVFVLRAGGPADKYVETELWKTFETICNKNPSTPDFMARYVDKFIRNPSEESELEAACENVMTIFRFLRDKDVFEFSYKLHLSRRLLSAKPGVGDEAEHVMVHKLRKECGNHITSKIEGMFNDRRLSAQLHDEFVQHLVTQAATMSLTPIGIEMHTTVLTSGFWPPTEVVTCRLPIEMERGLQAFRTFFLSRHKNRRLEYRFALGTVDIRMAHLGRRYELNVPTLCAAPLLLFEAEETSLTPTQVSQMLDLEIGEALKALAALVRNAATHSPLLRTVGNSCASGGAATSTGGNMGAQIETGSAAGGAASAGPSPPATVLHASAPLQLNRDFRSKHLKIKIAAVTVAREKDASAGPPREVRDRVDEDRKYKIDAAIVRVMKSRRTLAHQELVQEVQHVTRRLFVPTLDEIKRRIEHLIEREFIDRSPDSRSTYVYLA